MAEWQVFIADERFDGKAEWEVALNMFERSGCKAGSTIGADKGYGTAGLVDLLIQHNPTAPIARRNSGGAVEGRTARGKEGYAVSLRCCKMTEEVFGWIKAVGGLRKTQPKGFAKLAGQMLLTFAAYNLPRLLNLIKTNMPASRAMQIDGRNRPGCCGYWLQLCRQRT